MRLHRMAGGIQTFVAKSRDGALWRWYDSVDERLGHVELHLVALDKDIHDIRRSYRLEEREYLFASRLCLNLQPAAFAGQGLSSLDQIGLGTCEGDRTVSVQEHPPLATRS